MPQQMFANAAQEMKATAEVQSGLMDSGVQADAAMVGAGIFTTLLKLLGPLALKFLQDWLAKQQPPTPPAQT